MTTYKQLMTACAAVGAALLLGTAAGCDESKPQTSLLVDPGAAQRTEKMPSIMDEPAPIGNDTVVVGDTTALPDSTPRYEAICIQEAVPDAATASATVPAPCATVSFHEVFPAWSTTRTGTHIKTGKQASNYDVGGGKIMRHIKIWPAASTYTWL